jgi:hypothetical protein
VFSKCIYIGLLLTGKPGLSKLNHTLMNVECTINLYPSKLPNNNVRSIHTLGLTEDAMKTHLIKDKGNN